MKVGNLFLLGLIVIGSLFFFWIIGTFKQEQPISGNSGPVSTLEQPSGAAEVPSSPITTNEENLTRETQSTSEQLIDVRWTQFFSLRGPGGRWWRNGDIIPITLPNGYSIELLVQNASPRSETEGVFSGTLLGQEFSYFSVSSVNGRVAGSINLVDPHSAINLRPMPGGETEFHHSSARKVN